MDWDVHWGYELDFDPWPCGTNRNGAAATFLPQKVFDLWEHHSIVAGWLAFALLPVFLS